jgi:hypothetical protein
MLGGMRRALFASIIIIASGCSSVVDRSNAGIEPLERGPAAPVAVGAKYAGWIAAAPLVLAAVPVGLAAWATPWADLADFADIVTAPGIALGWTFEACVGGPAKAAVSLAGEDDDDPRDVLLPWGFVVERYPSSSRAPEPVPDAIARAYAPSDAEVARIASALDAELALDPEATAVVPLEDARADLEVTLADGGGRSPLVLITPPNEGAVVARWMAARYARAGIHAAVIVPRDSLFLETPTLDARGIEERLRATVIEARAVTAALARRPDVERIVYVGVSAGGIFGAVLVAIEPRIERAALLMPGADLATLILTSDEATVEEWRERMAERGLDRDALARELARWIRTEPLALAPHVDPRRVVLFLARDDTRVPIAGGVALARALGGPETWILEGNHETAGCCFGFVLRRADELLLESR